jgi:asparagine synthase (glutamine-hydrolysing)
LDSDCDLTPIELADDLCEGWMRFFECHRVKTGRPPVWHQNAWTKTELPADRHWSEIDDFASGDIKVVWEPSRFSWVFPLVRAYWRTQDERYPALFWELLESWKKANPPNQGPHWKCGQEISFRVMACCFAWYGFWNSAHSTPRRITELAQLIAVSGRRIEANLSYALSQKNNHGMSEAAGLWTIGLLFPELRDASRWRKLGKRHLESQGRELLYADGGCSQHSVNYQRVMLHVYLWSMRLGDVHGVPLQSDLLNRVAASTELLYQLQDEQTGHLPCFGQDDGALVLPLNNCHRRDFRPVIQATKWLTTNTCCYGPGPWNEDLFWLFGATPAEKLVKPIPRRDVAAEESGCFTIRGESGFAFVRAPEYRHRPSQADALHVDVWWRGHNIVCDPGTFSYNASSPWDNPFAGTAYHSTVAADNADQMQRLRRFVWLPWLKAQCLFRVTSSTRLMSYWEGRHSGYTRLDDPVEHRRAIIRLGDEHYVVVDGVRARCSHQYVLHWLLADFPYQRSREDEALTLHTPSGPYIVQIATLSRDATSSLVRAAADNPRGWQASGYWRRTPALSLQLAVTDHTAWFWTLLGPANARMTPQRDRLRVASTDWEADMVLASAASGKSPLIQTASIVADQTDHMELFRCTSC